MAKFDAQNSAQGVHMQLDSLWAFDTQDAGVNDANNYSWLTSAGHDAQARGAGIAFSGGQPVTGAIERLEIDFGDDSFLSPDVVVSGLNHYLPNVTAAPSGQFFTDLLAGNDEIIGSDLDDFLYGYDGHDVMNGGGGKNRMDGGKGNDVITEGGTDTVFAGDDDDRVIVTSDVAGDGDLWNGGAGIDTFDLSRITDDGVENGYRSSVDLSASEWRDNAGSVESVIGFENVDGSQDRDNILGDDNANFLKGNAGDDRINGNGGNDVIWGGAGDDILNGGEGDDVFVQRGSDGPQLDAISGYEGYDRLLLVADDGDAVFDFASGYASLVGVEEIEFAEDGDSVNKTIIFRAGGAPALRPSHINGNSADGSADAVQVELDGAFQFDLSGWTFEDWSTDDFIRINGNGKDETVRRIVGNRLLLRQLRRRYLRRWRRRRQIPRRGWFGHCVLRTCQRFHADRSPSRLRRWW